MDPAGSIRPDVVIRPENPADVDAIDAVVAAAFRGAPHSNHAESRIVRALRSAGQLAVSLVASDHGSIIGHIALSPVTLSGGDARWYGLGPVAVVPGCQQHGIGSSLVRHGVIALHALDAAGCVVLGDPHFYTRFGFRAVPALALPGAPPGYFLGIAFQGTAPTGTVAYHEAFSAAA